MVTAFLYGLGTAVPLVIGAAIGLKWRLPTPLLAALMAFGAGTMIAAVTTELFDPAFESAGAAVAGSGLLAGATVYVVADKLLDAKLGSAAIGWSLMLGCLLDGVPENTALGVTLASSGGGLVLLVAVAVGNVPEAIGGASEMRRQQGSSPGRAMAVWAATGVLLVVTTVLASSASDSLGATTVAVVQAIAGGATIAVLADTLMPEAYRQGGWWVGIMTAAGFLVAFVLG